MLLVTGAFVIFSLLSFSTVRSSPMCLIQIGTRTLHVAYGGSFWLVLVIGKHIRVPRVTSPCPSGWTGVPVLPSPEPQPVPWQSRSWQRRGEGLEKAKHRPHLEGSRGIYSS